MFLGGIDVDDLHTFHMSEPAADFENQPLGLDANEAIGTVSSECRT